jgi:nucleotide-binding universal stress UspA family protein
MSQPEQMDVLLAAKPGGVSPDALRRAVQMAAASGGKVRALVVIEHPSEAAEAEAEAGRIAKAFSQREPAGRAWDVEVARGEPWRVILKAADSSDCGLIVMGPRERKDLASHLIGATGERVIHRARQPVLTVRRPAEAPYRTVVAATDFSNGSRHALIDASRWLDGTVITLLHAYRVPYEAFISRAANTVEVRQAAEQDRDRFLSLGDWPAGLRERLTCELVYGTPLEVLTERAREGRADLVVAGAYGRTGPFEKLLGGTAEQLLRELDADLLIAAQSEANRPGA